MTAVAPASRGGDRLGRHLVVAARWSWLPVCTAVATFAAAAPALGAYQVRGAAELLASAAVASTLAAYLLARVARQGPLLSYTASVLGLVLLLAAGCGLHPATIARSVAEGPNRLLTETLPIAGPRAAIAALIVLTWVCGAALAEILSRSSAEQRGLAAVGLAIPFGLFVLCYAVSVSAPGARAGRSGGAAVGGAAVLVTVAAAAAARERSTAAATALVADSDRPGSSRWSPAARGTALGGAAAVVLAAGLMAAAPELPTMARPPASLHTGPPTRPTAMTDPVDAMGQFRDADPHAPPTDVGRVELSAPSTGYLAMATLDDYDGVLWQFDSTFEPTGGRIPAGVATAPLLATSEVTQWVTVESHLPVALLPALDRASVVTGLDVVADPSSGMILPEATPSGPLSYTVVSRTPVGTLGSLSAADGIAPDSAAAGAPVDAADLALPSDTAAAMGTTLRFLTSLTGQRPSATLAYLQDLLGTLQSKEKRVVPANAPSVGQTPSPPNSARKRLGPGKKTPASRAAPPPATTPPAVTSSGGTSLSEVVNAVTNYRSATPEQFATLYALVARYLGIPARVVTGFRLAPTDSGGLAAGSYEVTNREAWTWVEVPVDGIGWVVADPTPDATTGHVAPPPQQSQSPTTTVPPRQANAVPRNEIAGGHALARPSHPKIRSHHTVNAWLVALLAVAAVVLAAVAAGPGLAAARRARRRRSRRSTDPSELAVGAWLELLDGLHRAGMDTPSGSTSTEVANGAGQHFGDAVVASVARVGALAEQAVCSTKNPPDAPNADASWTAQRDVQRTVLRSLDRRQRARAMISVGTSPRRPSARSGRG